MLLCTECACRLWAEPRAALSQPFPQSCWTLAHRLIVLQGNTAPLSLYQRWIHSQPFPATAPGRGAGTRQGLPHAGRGVSVRAGQVKVLRKASRAWISITAGSNHRGWFIPDLTCTAALAQDTFLSKHAGTARELARVEQVWCGNPSQVHLLGAVCSLEGLTEGI